MNPIERKTRERIEPFVDGNLRTCLQYVCHAKVAGGTLLKITQVNRPGVARDIGSKVSTLMAIAR